MRIGRALSLVGVLVLLGGCASYTTVEGSDYTANTPLMRASFPVGEPGPRQMRIQASVARQEGRFNDGVEAGRTASVDNVDFAGPTNLKAKVSVTTAHVGVVFPIPVRDGNMRWEPTAGGALISSRLQVSDAATSATLDDERYPAPSGGIAFIMNTADKRFGLRAAVDYTWAGEVAFAEEEVFGYFAPNPHLEFLLGYRHFDYKYSAPGSSNIYLTLAGPAAGIHIRF